MRIFNDQLGNKISIRQPLQRIVSLVPSQTELLYDLGLDKEVAGITKFCIHPEHWHRDKTRVGGTKTIDIEKIKDLEPDLIIANKEENTEEQVRILQSFAPVWISDVNDLDDALQMISAIGEMTGKASESLQLTRMIGERFNELRQQVIRSQHQPAAAYLIWKDPYMAAGGKTFINDMMGRCGLQNVFSEKQRYPEITPGEIKDSGCELLLLSSEPYPFKEKHVKELASLLPGVKIILVDGEMFSWYGSRLQYAPEYFKNLLAQF